MPVDVGYACPEPTFPPNSYGQPDRYRRMEIASDEAHLWVVSCSTLQQFGLEALDALDQTEREQMFRLRAPRDRERFSLRRNALRHGLSSYLGVGPAEIRFEKESFGKPWIAAPEDSGIHFNVSHSHDWIAIGVSRYPIGIDIECAVPFEDWEGAAAQFCTAEELTWLREAPSDELWRRFFQLWTCKEAYAKAEGLGLGLDFSSLSLPSGMLTDGFEGILGELRVHARFESNAQYALAVATHPDVCRQKHFLPECVESLFELPPNAAPATCKP